MSSSSFEIATATPPELPQLADLIRDIVEALPYYNARAKREELAKYTADALSNALQADAESVLVARRSSAIVGFLISRQDDGLRWLSWFGVLPDARGAGVGNALLGALGDLARKENTRKVWCDSRTDNDISARVLVKAGFTRIATFHNHWYGQDFHIWEWYP